MRFSQFIVLAGLPMLVYSCHTPKHPCGSKHSTRNADFFNLAVRQLGSSFDVQYNESATFVLCQSTTPTSGIDPFGTLRFLVYDISLHKIAHQQTLARGEVSWHDDTTLKIVTIPGIIATDTAVDQNIIFWDVKKKNVIRKDYTP